MQSSGAHTFRLPMHKSRIQKMEIQKISEFNFAHSNYSLWIALNSQIFQYPLSVRWRSRRNYFFFYRVLGAVWKAFTLLLFTREWNALHMLRISTDWTRLQSFNLSKVEVWSEFGNLGRCRCIQYIILENSMEKRKGNIFVFIFPASNEFSRPFPFAGMECVAIYFGISNREKFDTIWFSAWKQFPFGLVEVWNAFE